VNLLASALDYAGLYPPAGLGMAEAARNYAAYRRSAHRELLGRFVVPLARLPELESVVRSFAAADVRPPWELTVLGGGDPAGEREQIADFAARHGALLSIRSVERKVTAVDEIPDVVRGYRAGGGSSSPWDLYLEVPSGTTTRSMLESVAAAGVFAKARTGGTTVDSFPSADAVAGFVSACSSIGVPFKATAGLHHALRGEYRVDYTSASPCSTMHGFLNLFVGAVLLDAGKIDRAELATLLEERTAGALRVDASSNGSVRWRDREAGPADIRRARTRLLHSSALARSTSPWTSC
jgi:hypothetical protein